MFTGLIEEVGYLLQFDRRNTGSRLVIRTQLPTPEIRCGDSLAINGICLTVVHIGTECLSFDVSPESLRCSALDSLSAGSEVNIERALKLSDRMGGHWVTGHIDGIATILERQEISAHTVFSFHLPENRIRYLVSKGSVAIDGVSLTVNEVQNDRFSVNIIPHTLQSTTFHRRKPGEVVNIETDILARYIEKLLVPEKKRSPEGLTIEALSRAGFL